MQIIDIHENGIYMLFMITDECYLKLLHFSARPFHEEELVSKAIPEGFHFIGMELAGYDRPYERHGNKFIVTAPGYRMQYVRHENSRNDIGRLLTIDTQDKASGVCVRSYLQFYDGLPILRCFHRVTNQGHDKQTLTYISTFNYEGIEKEGSAPRDDKMEIWFAHNSWQRELNWKRHRFADFGMEQVQPADIQRSSNMLRLSNTGNWSAKEYLPMGYLQNNDTHTGLFWQIEHNGSWHWEIGDQNGHMYLALGGPNELYSHWFKELEPGESFETVPAAIGVTASGFDDAMGALTRYRRRIRRPNADNESLPIIFNDYMNCLWGHPTAEEEFPLVDAAAAAGCEYFCIDAGWYADGDWWDSVGEWKESRVRFPGGVREITDYIRLRGMIPGVWLEPEVMGIHCPIASKVPDDWFFVRHGKRIYDRSRFQLDYRNPAVRAHMDEVVDRLVADYGVGYIKMDYNIEPGTGTELYTDSTGDALLEHERAYLKWLDGLWSRHPELIIENCSSGGLRMDYAMLSRCSIQSTSDQDDYLKYAVIAANAPTGVTPEQAAVWTYPMNHGEELSPDQLREETIFNMVNAMLLRVHQSGQLAKLDEERRTLVTEALTVYKELRPFIAKACPFWPLGLAGYEDVWVCLGLTFENRALLAVWKRTPDSRPKEIPLNGYGNCSIRRIYPAESSISYQYDANRQILTVEASQPVSACIFEIIK